MTTVTSDPDRPASTPERVRSAVYLDVDNVFGGLFRRDPAAALAFIRSPQVWLDALADRSPERRPVALVRRAYLNPDGVVSDPGQVSGDRHIRMARFRRPLVDAGFEVVDCPSLAGGMKNAADIRIVLDAADAAATGHYDEVVIASSDADFTPLLHRVRALGVRAVIVSASTTASAYRNVADEVVEAWSLTTPAAPTTPPPGPAAADDEQGGPTDEEDAPSLIVRLARATWLPLRVPTATWPIVFSVLAAYDPSESGLPGASCWARERLAELGVPVGRSTLDKVVRGLRIGGAAVGDEADLDTAACAAAAVRSVGAHALKSEWSLTEPEVDELRRWFGGEGAAPGAEQLVPATAA